MPLICLVETRLRSTRIAFAWLPRFTRRLGYAYRAYKHRALGFASILRLRAVSSSCLYGASVCRTRRAPCGFAPRLPAAPRSWLPPGHAPANARMRGSPPRRIARLPSMPRLRCCINAAPMPAAAWFCSGYHRLCLLPPLCAERIFNAHLGSREHNAAALHGSRMNARLSYSRGSCNVCPRGLPPSTRIAAGAHARLLSCCSRHHAQRFAICSYAPQAGFLTSGWFARWILHNIPRLTATPPRDLKLGCHILNALTRLGSGHLCHSAWTAPRAQRAVPRLPALRLWLRLFRTHCAPARHRSCCRGLPHVRAFLDAPLLLPLAPARSCAFAAGHHSASCAGAGHLMPSVPALVGLLRGSPLYTCAPVRLFALRTAFLFCRLPPRAACRSWFAPPSPLRRKDRITWLSGGRASGFWTWRTQQHGGHGLDLTTLRYSNY